MFVLGGRFVFVATNLCRMSPDASLAGLIGMGLGDRFGFETVSLGALSTPGVGPVIGVSGKNLKLTYSLKITGVGTSVTVRLEGTIDDDNWFNLSYDEADIVKTTDGVYAFVLTDVPIAATRMRFVSSVGGSPLVEGTLGSN